MNRNEAIEQTARKLQLQKLGGYGIDANTWVELGEALAMPKDDSCAVCGEVYQVVGALWNGETNLVPVLDNLSASATGKPIPHDTLLPFVPKAEAERVALLERIDNTIQAIEFGGIPSRELMRDIRAYLQGGA